MPKPQRRNQSGPGWDASRCHRVIRPLTALLGGLKCPFATTPVISRKQAKRKSDDTQHHPSQSDSNTRRSRQAENPLLFSESQPSRRRIPYTYLENTRWSALDGEFTCKVPIEIHDIAFGSPTIGFDNPTATRPHTFRARFLETYLNPVRPEILLRSLENDVPADLFRMYSNIYATFERILKMTTPPPRGYESPPLWVLAARKIAVHIITTEDKMEPGGDLYGLAGDTGIANECRREILRWHAVELVKGAICAGLFPLCEEDWLGLPGVLVGLCRQLKANTEAESLLKALAERCPLSESIIIPWLLTLTSFWRGENSDLCRLLENAFVDEGNPVVLANITIKYLLKQSVESIEYCKVSRKFVTRALDVAFGIWGKGHGLSAAKRSEERAERKGERRTSRVTTSKHDRRCDEARKKPVNDRIAKRAQDMAFYLTEKIFIAVHGPINGHPIEMVENLTRGFLLRDETMRISAEDGWSWRYPTAAKVAILLLSLGRDLEYEARIVGEIVRCLDKLNEDDLQSLGAFVAWCYGNLYTAAGDTMTSYNEVYSLVQGLISYAETGTFSPNTASAENSITSSEPTAPLNHRDNPIFTPGKTPIDSRVEKERYYISRLAVSVATGFSSLDGTKHVAKWNTWHKEVVGKVIALKLRTPAVPAEVRKERRYEEEASEWAAVGGTPSDTLLETERKKVEEGWKIVNVEIQSCSDGHPDWRDEYEIFSDIGSEEEATRYDPRSVKRMRVDTGTSDDEEEDEPSKSYHCNPGKGGGSRGSNLVLSRQSRRKQGRRLWPREKGSDGGVAR